MLDLTTTATAALLTLNKVTPKRSGGDDDELVCVLEFVGKVDSEDTARICDHAVPGALALWQKSRAALEAAEVETEVGGAAAGSAAAVGTFGQITVKIPDRDRQILVQHAESGRAARLDSEVLAVAYKVTPKVSVYALKVLVHGIEPTYIGWLASWLGQVVNVSVDNNQQVLPFASRAASAPEIGQIVSGIDGEEYAGQVVSKSMDEDDGQMLEIVDLDGEPFLVRVASVSGCINVPNAEEFLSDRILDGMSWKHLVVALGQTYLAEGSSVEDGWSLTVDIVNRALDLLGERETA